MYGTNNIKFVPKCSFMGQNDFLSLETIHFISKYNSYLFLYRCPLLFVSFICWYMKHANLHFANIVVRCCQQATQNTLEVALLTDARGV
jgi:hypothetical protein